MPRNRYARRDMAAKGLAARIVQQGLGFGVSPSWKDSELCDCCLKAVPESQRGLGGSTAAS